MKNYFYYNQLKLKTHYLKPFYNEEKRRIRVLLPKNYENHTDKYYPVVYMHDGQNVFYSKESFSGHSWKVIPHLKNNANMEVIIVGIDNDGEKRLDEYAPWVFDDGTYGGEGFEYAKWVTEEVKPFIDQNYRTLSDRKNTSVVGSSMGGIISAFMGSLYPDVYGVLGVFSLASWLSEKNFQEYIKSRPLHPDTKVYIQVGTQEGNDTDSTFSDVNINQAYINSSLYYVQSLIKTGVSIDNIWLRILYGETHSEEYWAEHFGEFLIYALE